MSEPTIDPGWAPEEGDRWLSRYALLDDDQMVYVPLRILRGLRLDVERYQRSLAVLQRKKKRRVGAVDFVLTESGAYRWTLTAATKEQERDMAVEVARAVMEIMRGGAGGEEKEGEE